MTRNILSKLLIVLCFSFVLNSSNAQLYEVSLETKIANSSLIVEGRVTDQYSFWNPAHTMIYTSSKVEIYKVFKGTEDASFIEVLTVGGTVENQNIQASELLELDKGHVGTFFCFPNSINLRSPKNGTVLWDVYSSSQGYFDYDLLSETAEAPFVHYNKISTDLYTELISKIGHGFINRKPWFNVSALRIMDSFFSRTTAPAITSFSPTTVNAGAFHDPLNNVLTINGSGFGASFSGSASIQFADANNASGSYTIPASDALLSTLVISWTDVQIQVRVPTRAGTGTFVVRDPSGVAVASSTPLNVYYAVLTANFLASSPTHIKQLNLMNDNGAGGYTIMYSTSTNGGGVDFTTSPALQTFQRALTTWKEVSGFNVVEGGNTTSQTISPIDGINKIMFDNTNTGLSPLADGVLATCYSISSICTDNMTINAGRKTEIDIVVRNNGVSVGGGNFTYGPCPPNATSTSQIDLETVLLHELGHALNLAHIRGTSQGGGSGTTNPPKLMNYAISNGLRRTSLDASARDGAVYTCTPRGNFYGSCSTTGEMTKLSTAVEPKDACPLVFPVLPTAANTLVSFDMVHTTSNVAEDPGFNQISCASVNGAVTNNAYYAIRANSNGILSVSVSSYVTVPTTLASCSSVISGVKVTGFRLLIYQVSSCPSGGNFPAPVACRDIEGNGALADITGLTANATYLIFIEAYENTKATFNLLLNGSALPIKFVSFTGQVADRYNNLDWVAESVLNVSKLVVQKSTNGTDFENIGEVTGNSVYNKNGNFKDFKPFIGNTYYRLKIINNNGNIEYSSVLLLRRNDRLMVSINPNPAVDVVEVQVAADAKGSYNLVLHNASGQKVLTKTISTNAGVTVTRLDVGNLPKGMYSVTLFDQKHEKLKSVMLSVQ